LIRKSEENFAYAGYLIRLRPNTDIVLPSYLNLYLASPNVRDQIELTSRSTSGVNNINSQEIQSIRINLPPLLEQIEIVEKVEESFQSLTKVCNLYSFMINDIEKLDQSILAKAFGGELVAQDPNDEPASVLLERIKAEREQVKPKNKGRRK
jgi:type I restriction enzyme, S subunit